MHCDGCKKLVFANVAGEEVNLCPFAGLTSAELELSVSVMVHYQRKIPAPPPCFAGKWPDAWMEKNGSRGAPGVASPALPEKNLPLVYRPT